jgi:hypothetical protein
MKRILFLALAAHLAFALPSLASAQTRGGKRVDTRPAPAAPAPAPEVDIHSAFALATPAERWALEDPMPASVVDFGGKKISLDDRQVNASDNSDGEHQLLFPVSWFEPYQSQNPDLKYVVVKYKDGKACSIMAEYLPNRLSMPRASFQPHPDGKSFYSDVSTVRQEGHIYYKQAISQGKDDGKGGLWVDMVVMYCMDDTTSKPAVARKP